MKNIALLGSKKSFLARNLEKIYKDSIVSLRDINWMNKLDRVDFIINLVGKAHDHNKTATEEDFYYANVDLVKQVFYTFVKSNAKLLIHVSSLAAVEEFESKIPLTEDATCNPKSWYGQTKREAEKWLLSQVIPEGKTIIILRPPMIHGDGDKGNLGLLYKIVSKGIPYPLASFENSRSFISIDNFTFFIENILDNYEKLPSGIYHVSDDESLSTLEIVDIIKEITKKNGVNIFISKPIIKTLAKVGDVIPIILNSNKLKKMTCTLLVSNQKLKKILGIKQLPLTAEEGLRKTIESFKAH
ncbi:NAD-dependent epimerase/dehydratase family protein [Sphingobacterium sp. Mn56C]|uniref:NAD-dependent epimerase/dehydratase family protein n=1 Tax=Sphingobacterium sp. Mn56C TaxID=3395261 RepID=UPI003BDD3E65